MVSTHTTASRGRTGTDTLKSDRPSERGGDRGTATTDLNGEMVSGKVARRAHRLIEPVRDDTAIV